MAQLKVLVVEDDPTVQEVLTTLLGFEGCQVEVAGDGRAGLEAAARLRPDVVLLDIMMPGMDGYDVCRALKSEPDPPKVVMVTAKTSAEDERKGISLGADAYLRKPFSPLELLRVVGVAPDGRP
ncbi:MAG TPA: response regulator [Actinomycetota bacterium]|nr:response regulator [Actinomycetota bacterium]